MTFKRYVIGPVKYCFVDFDGTVRELSKEGWAPTKMEDIKIFPWAPARLQEARQKGYVIVGITNQAYTTNLLGEAGVSAICDETVKQLGLYFPYFFAKNRDESKPNTFLIDQAIKKYGEADKATSLFIGDSLDKDGGIAKNFGIKYMTTEEFKEHGVP